MRLLRRRQLRRGQRQRALHLERLQCTKAVHGGTWRPWFTEQVIPYQIHGVASSAWRRAQDAQARAERRARLGAMPIHIRAQVQARSAARQAGRQAGTGASSYTDRSGVESRLCSQSSDAPLLYTTLFCAVGCRVANNFPAPHYSCCFDGDMTPSTVYCTTVLRATSCFCPVDRHPSKRRPPPQFACFMRSVEGRRVDTPHARYK